MEDVSKGEIQELDLRDYLRIIVKRKKLILSVIIFTVISILLVSFSMQPVYRATTRLQIDRENPNVVSFEDVMKLDTTQQDYLQTQYKIITSEPIMKRVIGELNLASFAPFSKSEDPIETLVDMVRVDPIRNSRLVDISVKDNNPVLAAKIANTVAKTYARKNIENRMDATSDAVKWLEEEVERTRKKLIENEQALQGFKEDKQVVSVEEKQNIVVQRLKELSSAVTKAREERINAESNYNELLKGLAQKKDLEILPVVRDSDALKDMKKALSEKRTELAEKKKVYREKHPEIIRLQSEIDALNQELDQSIQKVVNSLKVEFDAAKAKEDELQAELARQEKSALELNKVEIEYNILNREAQTTREIYESILKRLKETTIQEKVTANNIRIVEAAKVPEKPIEPNLPRNMILALFLGAFLGFGIAFLLESLQRNISSKEDADKLGLNFLGYVPNIDYLKNRKPDSTAALFTMHDSKSSASESLRKIRTNIDFLLSERKVKSVVVTSSLPGEGKTVISVNLGIILTQINKRVILIDGDMRKSTLHKYFDFPIEPGLRDILESRIQLEDAARHTLIPDLDVLTSGKPPANPSELLSSSGMSVLLEQLKTKYDYIIIDTPPVIAVTDAVIVAQATDAAVLVARFNRTHMKTLAMAKKNISDVNANLLGIIINDAK